MIRLPARLRARRGLLACALSLVALRAHAAGYTFDPQHSFVQFELMHFGTSTIRGRFGPLQGHVTLDPEAASGEIGLRIETRSVDTGLPVFDARLREPDLLASAAQPEAWFVARRFRFEHGRLAEVRGEFTLRGVSRPLSLVALSYGCRDDARWQREVCGGDFEASFDRSEFGMTFGLPFVGNRVRLVVQVEAVKD